MFRIPDTKSNHWFTSSHEVVQAIAELVAAIGSRVSRKTVNSIGRGPTYQDSSEFHIARQQ